MYKRLKKSNHTQNTLTTSLVTIIGFTPSLWLIWNLFEKLPFEQLKVVTFFSRFHMGQKIARKLYP